MDEKTGDDVEMKEVPSAADNSEEKPKETVPVVEENGKVESESTEIIATPIVPPAIISSNSVTGASTKKKTPNKQKTKRKKKPPKDLDAPKIPLTGYVRYTNEKRDDIRKKHPGASAIDVTKILAEDWNKLPDEDKKPYLRAAEIDRERYHKEIGEYKQQNELKKAAAVAASNGSMMNDACNEVVAPTINKTTKEIKTVVTEKPNIPSLPLNGKDAANNGNITQPKDFKLIGEIPIFTDEFLEHNKNIDSELRILRKSNTDYEQQNAVLEKHVENMSNGIEKLDTEMNSLKENNLALDKYLDILKTKLATALSGLSLPGHPNGATADNIDEYMAELQEMATSNTHPPATINKAKDIIRKLDLSIQI